MIWPPADDKRASRIASRASMSPIPIAAVICMRFLPRYTICIVAAAVLALPLEARAQAAAPASAATTATTADPNMLSAICTDRPTKSNVPCTVDAGHFQIESDLYNGTYFKSGGVETDTYLVTNPTFKYGLTKTLDAEVNIAPYEVVASRGLGVKTTLEGVGDLYLRLKYNFLSTASGWLTASVIPYVKAPTARLGIGNGAVEGGALMPTSFKLSDKLTLTSVPEMDAFKDAAGDGRHLNTAQLVNLAYSLPRNVTVYGEVWGDWNFDPTGTIRQYSADVAATWGMTNYLQFDIGLNFGLNQATPGVQAYAGVSKKF
jgi:hypothetical protein